jgi:hypothetical protein
MLRARSLALVVAAATGCSHDAPPAPSTLVDGSPARPPRVALEGGDGPPVATRARVLRADSVELSSTAARCLVSIVPDTGVVERIGVNGTSVTFLGSRGRELHACDASTARTRNGRPWCGRSFARLRAGRLRDPRLSLSCRSVDDRALGFAWIQPGARTAYVVVAQPGYDEVYPVAGDLPVRVTTADVDLARSGAVFAVSEHARDGGRLRSYELEARASG